MQALSREDFKQIVKNTPLVSIDLIIENSRDEVLLGWRNNAPAKAYWFVPGGRIRKDEGFADAFLRITEAETGMKREIKDSLFLGVYEHIYPSDNFAEDPEFGTHYIVIAYRLRLRDTIGELPLEQHADYRWATVDEILDDANVHPNTRNYFNGTPSFADHFKG